MSTVPHDQSQRLTASSPDDGACDSFFLSIDNHPTSTIMRPNQSTQQKSRRHVKGALFAEDKTSSENLTLQTHTRNKISDDESQGRDDPLRELPNNALPLIDQITDPLEHTEVSPCRFSEIQATLQTRISDVIASTDNDNLCTTTSNQFNFPNTVQAETLLGSSCDEISETQEDEEDNYDDDVGQMDPIDSYGSTSDIRLRNLCYVQNGPCRTISSSISDLRGFRRPTIGEDDFICTSKSLSSSSQPARLKNGRHTGFPHSESSFNCSTTASISGRSTSSSVSKALRSSFVEDGAASSKSSLGGISARQRCGELLVSTRTDTSSPTAGGITEREGTPQDGGEEQSRGRGTAGRGIEEESWDYTPFKTARESATGRLERRSSLGLGTISSPSVKVVEAKDETTGRLFRMVHKTKSGRPGILCTQTRIDVIDTTIESKPSLFTVRHSDPNLWGRQMKVHKNIMLACRLAGVDVPKEIEIPIDSKKMFEQNDNIQSMNSYLERIVPYINIGHIAKGVQLYWWKAIGNGLAVLQNQISGKLVLLKNPERTVASAVDRIVKLLNCSKLKSSAFWEPEEGYPNATIVEQTLQDSEQLDVHTDMIEDLITRIWGTQERVSPLQTELVLKVQATKFLRYSIGADVRDAKTLLIQVHLNEPLSRGMIAYPVCMVPMSAPSSNLRDLRLTFLQSVWFLRKLYDLHCEAESGINNSCSINSPISQILGDTTNRVCRGSETTNVPSRFESDHSVSKESLSAACIKSSATRNTPRRHYTSLTQLKSSRADPPITIGTRPAPVGSCSTDDCKKLFRSTRQPMASDEPRRQISPNSTHDDPYIANAFTVATGMSSITHSRTPVPTRKEHRTITTENFSIRFVSGTRHGCAEASVGATTTRQDVASTPRLRSQTACGSLTRPTFTASRTHPNRSLRRSPDDSLCRPSRIESDHRSSGGSGEGITRQISTGECARGFPPTPHRVAASSGLRASRRSHEVNLSKNQVPSAGSKQASAQRSESSNLSGLHSTARVGVYIRGRKRPLFAGCTSRVRNVNRRTSLTLPSTEEGAAVEESEESTNTTLSN